jgi:transcriptional regulator with XRE-family HTH domain
MSDLTSTTFEGNVSASAEHSALEIGGSEFEGTSFGACIRTLRKRAGLSLTEMAARIGLSVSHYHRIEFDEKAPLDSTRWGPLIELGADASVLATLEQQSRADRKAQRRSRHHTERAAVMAGLPGSSSWDELSWEEDDACWYAVACHPHGLTIEQVAALTGYTSERVRQIELEALAKLSIEPDAVEAMEVVDDRENQRAIWGIACEEEMMRKLDDLIAR